MITRARVTLSMRRSCLVASLLVLGASPAAAQELRLSAVQNRTSESLWGNPRGWALSFHVPASDRLSFLVGVSAFSSRQDRVGIPCAGLIQPGTCAPEPLKDLARLVDVRFGLSGKVVRRERVAVSLVADAHWIEGTSDTDAPASKRALSASQGYWGPGVGADVSFKPNPAGALGFFVAAHSVWWRPRSIDQSPDKYSPFSETVRAPSFSAGASWAVRLFQNTPAPRNLATTRK